MDSARLAGRKVVVYGLGRSGRAALRLLLREGARPVVLDRAAPQADLEGVEVLPPARAEEALRDAALLVVSPGVPLALPEIQEAKARGLPVWGEVELAWRFLPPAPLVGITGTNGKSTTTALCGALLEAGGRRPFVGGNLGRALSEAALSEDRYDAYVVELSSFQLEGIVTLRAEAAAILNLQPDHLDRYPDAAAYAQAKARILLNQEAGDLAVANADDPAALALVKGAAKGQLQAFSTDARAPCAARATPDGFQIAPGTGGAGTYRVTGSRTLRGAHNLQNAMAAALLAGHLGVRPEAIQAGLDAYPGLPHRLESVAVHRGVEWVNDSKATNVDAALVALGAFGGGLWWILGGRGKGAPYRPLVEASRGKVKGVLTLGEDAPAIEAAFREATGVQVHPCGTLDEAVRRANNLAVEGDVVLLSPACASYDQFKNFEHRGDTFKALVQELSR